LFYSGAVPVFQIHQNVDEDTLKFISQDHDYCQPYISEFSQEHVSEMVAHDHSYSMPSDSPQIIELRPRFISFIITVPDGKFEFEVNKINVICALLKQNWFID
jgi:hypothetical protein